jgi:photosystem II stability/assembly factor-like uncharacterized protein
MKLITIGIRLVLGTLFLLASVASAAPGGAILPASAASAAAQRAVAASGDLRAFQLVTPSSGWALVGQQLFWTDSGGSQWSDITPLNLGPGTIRAASFADAAHGWVVTTSLAASGDLGYTLARTADGGQSWQSVPLALFFSGDAAGVAGDVYLEFIDARAGWLVVKQATSSNFNLGTLFKTNDGGDNWTRLNLRTGAPVRFTSALDGQIDASSTGNGRYVTHDGGQTWTEQAGVDAPLANGPDGNRLSAVSMATTRAGWARSSLGKCDTGTCALVTRLLSTTDGGQSWTPVSLPDGQPAVEQTFAAPSTGAPGQSVGGLRLTYDGHGFDSCKNDGSLPATGDMQTWYSDGPYGAWNLYIGGSSRANCGTLTRAYVQQLAQQGWLFIPTWVGPQAPCSNLGTRMSFDLTTAHNQGVTEAFLARNLAKNLGLTLPDLSGTVIYYDVEYYLGDQACRDAVKSFISGWSGELRATGDKAGVYGAPCGQSLSDFAQVANVPDMIWIAWWGYPGYDPSASVWNAPCLSNTLWSNGHQRLRQYAGGHDENWGGVDFNIDSDAIAGGNVSTITDACKPAAGQVALFVYPNFGGQCVLKGIGPYPTAASIGLPMQSISSLRVSTGITVTLCQGQFYAPACSVFGTDQADLGGAAVGDDLASSAMVITGSLPLTNTLYLPIVGVNAGLSMPLANGGFENGPAQWDSSSAQARTLIVPSSVLTTSNVAPHSGDWAAWLGGAFTETASVQQTVLIPPSAPYLAYWQWVDSAEAACYIDFASVWVNSAIVDSYGLCVGANTHGWVKRVLNLGASAGSAVALKFQVQTDKSVNSNLFLDDIALQSTP